MSWIITGTEKYETDPYRSQVSLLLHGDGSNGSTTIVDSSPTPKTVTAFGDAQISTAQSKFGGSSIAFDSSGDYLATTGSPFLTGDFTVEAWVHVATPSSGFVIFESRDMDLTNSGFVFYVRSTSKLTFGAGSPFVATEGTTNLSANSWLHAALVRSSGTVKGYLNGVEQFSVANSFNFTLTSWRVGSSWNAISASSGYIDDLRITKGVARYTSNFTPPTAPFPDI
jgi:hypothetical protein